MEHIALLAHVALLAIVVLLAGQAASIFLAWLVSKVEPITMELERMVAKLPPPPVANNQLNNYNNMTKYRVISRVLCDDGESCTFYYPQRKTLLRWKDIKQNGETVKFRNLYEAFRYIDGDPSATNVEQRPYKLSNHLDCWVYHFTARTTEKDLSEFLESVFEDVSVWRHHELMIISMPISDDFRPYLPVRPGDSVVLYPDGQVYVVPNLDLFPDSALSTK